MGCRSCTRRKSNNVVIRCHVNSLYKSVLPEVCGGITYSAVFVVWLRSAHTSQVDVQLNSAMRLISGTLHSTPLPWLPVLSNIELPLPALRRKADTDKVVEKIVKHDSLANAAWYPQPTIATTDIQEAAVAGLAISWHQKSMEA